MRWFKHMTRTWDDEKIAVLVGEGGIEAYGFYWRMVEIVASKVEDGSTAVCQYPVKTWARLCNVLANRWQRLANLSAKCGLLTVETFEGLSKVEIPTILKYRDEYSDRRAKTSSKNRDKLQSNSRETPEQETDTDTDTDTDKDTKKKTAQKGETPVPAPSPSPVIKKPRTSFDVMTIEIPPSIKSDRFLDAWKRWIAYRKEKRAPITETMGKTMLKQFLEWGEARAVAAIEHTIFKGWQGLFEPDQPKLSKQERSDAKTRAALQQWVAEEAIEEAKIIS